MGREIRRVPLDFSWPLNKAWEGFLNPHFKPCPNEEKGLCRNGNTCAGAWLDAITRFLSLLGEEAILEPYAEELRARGRTYPHPYIESFEQAPRRSIPREEAKKIQAIEDPFSRTMEWQVAIQRHAKLVPFTAELGELITALAGMKPQLGNGADYAIAQALLKAAGISPEARWGICKVCDGHADDPENRAVYEAWKETPPPTGEGWQLWETVSEGSPISPVFPTEEAFKAYLLAQGYSQAAADGFCMSGSAPSMVSTPDGRLLNDIEACAVMTPEAP